MLVVWFLEEGDNEGWDEEKSLDLFIGRVNAFVVVIVGFKLGLDVWNSVGVRLREILGNNDGRGEGNDDELSDGMADIIAFGSAITVGVDDWYVGNIDGIVDGVAITLNDGEFDTAGEGIKEE